MVFGLALTVLLGVPGLAVGALFGAHTINMAAITAAICLGPEVHPDQAERWRVGVAYGAWWILLAFVGPIFIGALLVMPSELMATIAGLALLNPLLGALVAAFEEPDRRFAAVTTLATCASGVTLLGIGSAFWGLVAGFVVMALEKRVRE